MYCFNCGEKNLDEAKFCCGCGCELLVNKNTEKNSVDKNAIYSGNDNKSINTPKPVEGLDKVSFFVDKIFHKFTSKFKNQKRIIIESSNFNYESSGIKPLTFSENIDTSHVKKDENKHSYTQLGGFLAFLVYGGFAGLIISMIGLGFAVIGYCFLVPYRPSYLFLLLIDIILGVVAVLLQFRLILKIKNKSVDFLHFYFKTFIICMIFYLFVSVVQIIISITESIPYSNIQYLGELIWWAISYSILSFVLTLAISTVGVILIALYFVKSVRVRTYMGTDMYAKLCFFTRNVKLPNPAYIQQVHINCSKAQVTANNESNNYFEKNKCSKCGADLKEGNLFCTSCGQKII